MNVKFHKGQKVYDVQYKRLGKVITGPFFSMFGAEYDVRWKGPILDFPFEKECRCFAVNLILPHERGFYAR
jgi:hypothetical protein